MFLYVYILYISFFFHFSGCRCPEGQLLQDGHCVSVTECRCGIPSGNGTLEFSPKEELSIDCNTWWEQLCVFFRCDKSKLQVWACRKVCSSWSVTLTERQSRLSDLIAVQVCESKLLSHFSKHLSICSVCENGTLVCTSLPCPVYEPWSPWSSCSVSCGRGQRTRTRLCQDTEGGPSCADTKQSESCDMPSCPGLTWNKCPHEQLRMSHF